MTKAMEKCPKRGRSAGRFIGSVLNANSKVRKTSSVKREKPRVEVHAEKKEGTTMTKGKRLDSLARLQSLMRHPYGVVFNDIKTIRECRPESFKKLKKPIDLETVKSTLENNLYFTVEAFAEDVRTTFSNAMQIFPATDGVHKMATKLSENFEMGLITKVESLNLDQKTCNYKVISRKKEIETQGKRTDSSSCKRKLATPSSGREKIYGVRQESDRKGNRVHKMATKLSENFEMGLMIKAEPKACNDDILSGKKEIQGNKTDSSSLKRKSAAASSGSKKIYVVRQESDRKGNHVYGTGTHLVKGKDGKSFDITVISGAPEKSIGKLVSPVVISPSRAARIAALMDRFSGTIKKAEKTLSASAPTNRDLKRKAQMKVIEQRKREMEAKVTGKRKREMEVKRKREREGLERMKNTKREMEVQLKEQRKRERESLERMENTAKFGADHEALKEFEWLLGHSQFTMTDNNRILAENIGEEVGVEEMEEGEIPPSPKA